MQGKELSTPFDTSGQLEVQVRLDRLVSNKMHIGETTFPLIATY